MLPLMVFGRISLPLINCWRENNCGSQFSPIQTTTSNWFDEYMTVWRVPKYS